jgi:hypothetical protein
MSVANAGVLAAANPPEAEDSAGTTAELLDPLSTPDDVHPVAPDQFDPRYETTKWEIWAYYSYYVGNNGLTLFNFAPTSFQNLLYEQAGTSERLVFLGASRTINSIVLLANGISFAIQVVLFLVIGSFADYGVWRPWILIFWSIVAFGLGFGWLGVHTEDKWPVATGLYMVGLIAYQMCITFWTAAFPGLARNTPELRQKAEEYQAGEIDREKYDFVDMMLRNKIQNMAFIWQSVGEVFILAILVGILWALHVNDSEANNNWGLSVLIAYCTGVWVLLAIPWFMVEKRRPGQPLPPGMNLVSVGFWQLYRAVTQIWRLKQSKFPGKHSTDRINKLRSALPHRLLPSRRLPQHNCHGHRNTSEHRCLLQHPNAHIPPNRRHRCAIRRHLYLLVDPKTLLPLHEKHVRRDHARHHLPRRMGHDRDLDPEIRLPQRMGVLGVSGVVWAVHLPVVLVLADHDQ